jgi:hypothetical protein
MNLLSRLFGKSAPEAKTVDPILHKDCRIYPQPVKDAGGYRVSAVIEKDFGAQVKTHHLIRADTCTSLEEATSHSVAKARQAIDQLGDTLFT